MTKQNVDLWGRNFDLDLNFDCYTGEEILESQNDAIKAFLDSNDTINDSLDIVKNYCLSKNKAEIGSEDIENIFKFVIPKYIFIQRNEKEHIVSLMCNYRFDPEDGIAVVFKNEHFFKIGKQDIIL